MSSLLRKKIFLCYIIITAIVLFLTVVMVNERFRFRRFEGVINETNYARENIHKAHLYITRLATLGESVIAWDESDYNRYHYQRLKTDSILLEIKSGCGNFLRPVQIDSLRVLLETKETHLFRIMKAVQSWVESDSLLANELPALATQTVRIKTITQKKKGIAGLFGKKETVQVPYITNEIQNFNKRLTSARDLRNNQMEIYVDSLRLQNRLLNHKLYDFVSSLDNQIQQSFTEQYQEITETRWKSFRLFAIVISIVIVLFVISFFIILSDLRKEEKIKVKLQQSVQENEDLLEMRKRIILTVSHDIRGPLGNIHNCADLASQTREKKKREPYLEDIRHSCHHILHLVNDLMDAYRINEAGDLRNDTPFYLDRFLQRISDEFSRKAVAKALYLQSEHQNSSFVVKGDADKLEQVLANLLTNAIKFTPSGTISFYSKYLEGKLHIEIRDTGIGMDEETQKRIFVPFERAAQNVNSEGFGLGLFLTKGLVKVLNGIITVESAPGKGSIFRLEIPLPETDELVEEDKTDSDSITILPKNVLVVDDDPILLKIAEDMLGRKGVSCTTCMNFQEVVAALGKSDYDMVLTDVQMPDTDGFALLRLLRNSGIGNSRTIPVAVMTARGDGNSGIYEKEGFAGCIHKPFNIHALLTFLSTIMSQIKVSQTGDFDFSCLLDSTDDYEHMMSLVIMESRKEIEELKTAIKTTNRESMRKTIHRMMPVWEILGKEHMLHDFQERLRDMNTSDETICEQGIQIIEWIEKLIKEAENELKKYENTDS
ncbi:hybrid sensor histidine kinase/response regulator [Bacteroides gallinaceum]|uniref:hybrid sensor histidine kinase/response regulator n=1 Tax=Bacteroides gallinaceum TaxID=1462571 RepID=UPI0025AB0841|nr:hybrid sensor histidine kinase/response regulator [Bacteroides gallinaceum]MDN0065049.1 hybrid sensor histidine kinase/response regulator [Bacteroides gallinaceum]